MVCERCGFYQKSVVKVRGERLEAGGERLEAAG
jgi:hypothetical protein